MLLAKNLDDMFEFVNVMYKTMLFPVFRLFRFFFWTRCSYFVGWVGSKDMDPRPTLSLTIYNARCLLWSNLRIRVFYKVNYVSYFLCYIR